MTRPNSNPDSSDASRDTVGFEDTNVQQPEQRDAASQLSSSDGRKEDHMKVEMSLWLSGSAPSRKLSPIQTRLKWCGCFASSHCAHFNEPHVSDTDISTSSNPWIPLPSFIPYGAQQYQQPEVKKYGSSLSKEREMFREPYHYDLRQVAKMKAQILSHPMYEELLAEHVECLRVATPVDHLQSIEAQLATMQHVTARYSGVLGDGAHLNDDEKEELDSFMVAYVTLLRSLKDRLGEHVRRHAMEAVASCWELEHSFISLTGERIGDGSGATMSDDDEEQTAACLSQLFELGDMNLGLGPMIPTESERSLMERMRQELKKELKQGYRNRISDVREEIMRKRRAGKLPGETTAILKKWWNSHSKWPYPTEDEKVRLVHETGLELKQINNWFINQRKRNWHTHSTTTSISDVPTNQTSVAPRGGQTGSLTLSFEANTTP